MYNKFSNVGYDGYISNGINYPINDGGNPNDINCSPNAGFSVNGISHPVNDGYSSDYIGYKTDTVCCTNTELRPSSVVIEPYSEKYIFDLNLNLGPAGSYHSCNLYPNDYNSQTPALIQSKPEENKMSIIHAAILKDGIVMVADSRSSKMQDGTWQYEDCYEKLYYFSDINLGVVSSGLNEFGGDTLTDLCKKIEESNKYHRFNSDERIDFVIDQLNNALSYYTQKTSVDCQVIYGFTYNQNIIEHDVKTPKIFYSTFSLREGVNKATSIRTSSSVTYGIPWIQNYFINQVIEKDVSCENYLSKVQKMFADLIAFSNHYENPSFVGGDVKAIIIR